MKMCSLCQLKDMRERFIERKFVEAVKKKGGFAPKFVSPGLDGMPDRIVLFPIGKIAFVELKAPGENMRPQRKSTNWGVPVVLYIRKVAGRDKHFVAYFLAALFPARSRCLYRCSKSLKVIFWYWSFCHIHSPSYILLFLFSVGYVYIVLIHNLNNSISNKIIFV